MNNYNLLNGVHATEHKWLNIDVLLQSLGLQRYSDVGLDFCIFSIVGTTNTGLDLEMPKRTFYEFGESVACYQR